jgi:hypothetical protein
MKNKILLAIVILMVAVMYNSCTTPPIEAAQEAYDYNAIIPKVLDGVQGPEIAIQTFTADYTIGYYRGGSTWNWSAADATVSSVSEDTRVATIEFNTFPADSFATVTVTETTMGGITSDPVSMEVRVKKYCPLVNGNADLVGSWSGDDGGYDSQITTVVSGTSLEVSGLSVGVITDWWGEAILEGGSFLLTVNEDGTLNIPRQYIYTTEWDGDPYRYEIIGSGTWDNCGTSPSLLISYDIYYEGDEEGIGSAYGDGAFTADIQLNP